MKRVIVVGATSGIAKAVIHAFAKAKYDLVLLARDEDDLKRTQADLQIRYAVNVEIERFDALAYDAHKVLFEKLFIKDVEGVFVAHGYLVDEEVAANNFQEAKKMIDVNYISVVSVLDQVALLMEKQKSGWIACISSVAGDRGRRSNYHYGSTKAAVTAYLQGLRSRLFPNGVHVLTIKPGFVATKMITGKVKDSILVATPEVVARDIVKAIHQKRNVLYTPFHWSIILGILKRIPEFIMKRLHV